MWQMDFAVAPEVLKDINHQIRVNEQVLRWVVVKRNKWSMLPYELQRLKTPRSNQQPQQQR